MRTMSQTLETDPAPPLSILDTKAQADLSRATLPSRRVRPNRNQTSLDPQTRDGAAVRARLVLRAWVELLFMDIVGLGGFKAIRKAVKRPSLSSRSSKLHDGDQLVGAVRRACIFYFKRVHCLQRSAAVTRLLRSHGINAALVIGCRPMPLKSHAWVEVDAEIVSDRTKGQEHFREVDRW